MLHITSNPNSINKFNKLIKSKNALVFIYSNHCGYCHEFKPIWKKFVKTIKNNNNFFIAMINTDALSELDMDGNIMGVPVVRYIKKISGSKIKEFNGPRTIDGLKNFYKKINNASKSAKNNNNMQTRRRNNRNSRNSRNVRNNRTKKFRF